MNRLFSTIFILFTVISLQAQTTCDRTTKFGTVDICLPAIAGYEECYLQPNVKSLADATEVPANDVLGFYINDEMMQRTDEIGTFDLSDYFKVYGTKQIAALDANEAILTQMKEMLAGTFNVKNWGEVQKSIDENIDLDFEVGVPTVVKTYELNDQSFTSVMLTKYAVEGMEPYTMAMTINGLLIHQRIVWLAYYQLYTDPSTIDAVQQKSDMILSKLLEANTTK